MSAQSCKLEAIAGIGPRDAFGAGRRVLRTMLIHGARSVIAQIERKPDQADEWLKKLLARRNKNIAAVALAAKNARIAWALLAHERSYESDSLRHARPHDCGRSNSTTEA